MGQNVHAPVYGGPCAFVVGGMGDDKGPASVGSIRYPLHHIRVHRHDLFAAYNGPREYLNAIKAEPENPIDLGLRPPHLWNVGQDRGTQIERACPLGYERTTGLSMVSRRHPGLQIGIAE